MIKASINPHANAINDLASVGKIQPVKFKTPDGVLHEANSVWAATDWLKSNGYYDKQRGLVEWFL